MTAKMSRDRMRGLVIAILTPIVIAGALASSFAAATPMGLADYRIADAVLKNLEVDPRVPSHNVDVSVDDAVVTLSGTVDNLLARDTAINIAEATKGVVSVVDRMELSPVRRPDKQILDDAQKALINDPAVESYELDVRVQSAVATLKGEVDSPAERRLAIERVKGVKGLVNVIDEIEVIKPKIRKDFKLESEIRGNLDIDPVLRPKAIDVEVENGIVELSGAVGSAAEKTRAVRRAWVIGVESVEAENLHIRWWERDTLTPSVGKLSDAQIESAVNRALESDPRVMAQNPLIKVNGGVVTLSGPVRSLSAKVAVEETALNTVGVRKVVNLTKVRPDEPVPKDSLLKLMVTNALKRDPYVESPDVDVDVMDGVVYLHGRVDSGFEKIRAQELASNTRGVLKVDNNLAFESGWDFKDDLELREDVEYQLFWSPFVDSDKIDVEVDHGSVILRGRVSSWQAYRSARSNALDAGAKDVRNQLIVEDQTVGTWF